MTAPQLKRILVCGSRTMGNVPKNYMSHMTDQEVILRIKQFNFVWKNLLRLIPERSIIISGMAKGPDTIAAEFARVHGHILKPFPADWARFGRSAGPIRNKQMLDKGNPDLVIAFPLPGSKGTKNMMDLARKAGVEVLEIEYV